MDKIYSDSDNNEQELNRLINFYDNVFPGIINTCSGWAGGGKVFACTFVAEEHTTNDTCNIITDNL